MVNRVITAKELENLGIPYDHTQIIDAWDTDNYIQEKGYRATMMVIFKLEDKIYGTEIFDIWPEAHTDLHWWSCHESEDEIVLIEMRPQEIVSIRYVPVLPDNSTD